MEIDITLGGARLELRTGNIVEQPDIAAIVNAANARLMPGGGVAGAIHRAAGPDLAKECQPLAPIAPGQAVLTGAYALPNTHVIHCLGPVYGVDEPSAELLADCYRNALRLAEQHAIASVAFPAISAGAFGYPTADSARVALWVFAQRLPACGNLSVVRMVLRSAKDLEAFREAAEHQGLIA